MTSSAIAIIEKNTESNIEKSYETLYKTVTETKQRGKCNNFWNDKVGRAITKKVVIEKRTITIAHSDLPWFHPWLLIDC